VQFISELCGKIIIKVDVVVVVVVSFFNVKLWQMQSPQPYVGQNIVGLYRTSCLQCFDTVGVLVGWQPGRKGIRPVKNEGMVEVGTG